MHELVAKLVARTGLHPDVVADLDPIMFTALTRVCGFGEADGGDVR